eukprot:764958-Hanusia_phi.AAC.5
MKGEKGSSNERKMMRGQEEGGGAAGGYHGIANMRVASMAVLALDPPHQRVTEPVDAFYSVKVDLRQSSEILVPLLTIESELA